MVDTTKQNAGKPPFNLPCLTFSLRCVLLANHSFQEFFKESDESQGLQEAES